MKYWLLTTEYPPFFGGGISTYCYNTARMMVAKGHALTVFINDASVNKLIEDNRDGVRVIRFNPAFTNSASFLGHTTNISYEFANIIRQYILQEGPPAIIEAQEYLGIAYYLLQFKKLLYDWCRHVPVVITMHSPSFLYMEYNQVPEYRYPKYWICEMERFCLQAADLIISPSNFIHDELLKRFALTNMEVVKVANPFVSRTTTVNTVNSKNGEIIFFGKLTAQKGAFKLMAYFKKLWDEGFSRPLTVIGGQDIIYQAEGITMGDMVRRDYRKYIRNGLLLLEDRINPAAVGSRLTTAEVVIVPSMNDNLPYVVFEMMALGKVLLVSRQGGQAEVIENNFNGFIFDHEQPETFGKQLRYILQLSAGERERISNAAIEKVNSDYNLDTIYKQKITAIEKLIEQPPAAANLFPFIRPAGQQLKALKTSNDTNALLSVVIPYYNMGKYIDETIRSIEECDYKNNEIIIVNDGSTDEASIKQLDKYRNHPTIKILTGPNRGVAHARNSGAAEATGSYLAFLDADDTVQPAYYSRAIAVLAHYQNVHFAGCWTGYFGNSSRVWPAFTPEPPIILYHNTVNSSALVYNREAFLAAGENDTRMAFQGLEDYDSVVSLLSQGYSGVVLPEILFNYRIRPDSMIRDVSKSKKLFLTQYIAGKYKKFYGTFAADLFNLLNANGPGISTDNPSLDHDLTDKLPFGGNLSAKLISLVKRNRHAKAVAYKIYRLIKK